MALAEVTLIMQVAPHWTGFGIRLAAPRTLITAMVFRQSAGFRGSSGSCLGEFAGDGRGYLASLAHNKWGGTSTVKEISERESAM
jgi:hypothetical protein